MLLRSSENHKKAPGRRPNVIKLSPIGSKKDTPVHLNSKWTGISFAICCRKALAFLCVIG